jgi:hypothetical protein
MVLVSHTPVALIGAGGLRQPILTGIMLNDSWLTLVERFPAAVPLIVQGHPIGSRGTSSFVGEGEPQLTVAGPRLLC